MAITTALAATSFAVLVPSIAMATPLDSTPVRLSGSDRYETAVAVAEQIPAGGPVVLVDGTGYADSTPASTFAAAVGGVVLPVPKDGLGPAADVLADRRPAVVYLVGGVGAVSDAVERQVRTMGLQPSRIAGATRFDTAGSIAALFPSKPSTVYLTTSAGFADALSGAGAAAREGAAVLLTAPAVLPDATAAALARIAPARIVVLGGAVAVSEQVEIDAAGAAGTVNVVRHAGPDRYATAGAVAEEVFAQSATAVLITGESFADALSAGPLAARNGSPILPVSSACVPGSSLETMATLGVSEITIVGGTRAIGPRAVEGIRCGYGSTGSATFGAGTSASVSAGHVSAHVPASSAVTSGKVSFTSTNTPALVTVDVSTSGLTDSGQIEMRVREPVVGVLADGQLPRTFQIDRSGTSTFTMPATTARVTFVPVPVRAIDVTKASDQVLTETIELDYGIGGSPCSDGATSRYVSSNGTFVGACVDTDGDIRLYNQSSALWVWVEPSVPLFIGDSQWDSPMAVRSTESKAISSLLMAQSREYGRLLPPHAGIDLTPPLPYTGPVTITVSTSQTWSLVPVLASAAPGVTSDVGDILKVYDSLKEFRHCGASVKCGMAAFGQLFWILADASVEVADASGWKEISETAKFRARLAISLAEANVTLARMVGEQLALYDNSISVTGASSPAPTTPVPVQHQPPATYESGELYTPGTYACASTYPGHPTFGPQWGPSVDINARDGDLGRPILMPWGGTVDLVRTGYGNGWGQAIVLNRPDGYRLFVSHTQGVVKTGAQAAGTQIAEAGNSGYVLGGGTDQAAHLHVNASMNGAPAPVVLGGKAIEPGACWSARQPVPVSNGTQGGDTAPTGASARAYDSGTASNGSTWMGFELRAFGASSAVTAVCSDAVDAGFYTKSFVTDGAGNLTVDRLCYTPDGGRRITVAGRDVPVGTTVMFDSGSTATPDNSTTSGAWAAMTDGGTTSFGSTWGRIEIRDFAAGSNVELVCDDDADQGFYRKVVTMDARGDWVGNVCYTPDSGFRIRVAGTTVRMGERVSLGGGTPTPSPAVTLHRGAPAEHGYWYDTTLTGFSPGSTVDVTCHDSVDQSFYTTPIPIGADGSGRDDTTCFSGDGPDHYVTTSTGHRSNTVVW